MDLDLGSAGENGSIWMKIEFKLALGVARSPICFANFVVNEMGKRFEKWVRWRCDGEACMSMKTGLR
jgi:hypothetical protein